MLAVTVTYSFRFESCIAQALNSLFYNTSLLLLDSLLGDTILPLDELAPIKVVEIATEKKVYQKTKYPSPPYGRTRVGRSLYVNGLDKKPLNNLSWDKTTGVYFYTPDRTKSFGVKYVNAVRNFTIFIAGLNSVLDKPDGSLTFNAKASIIVEDDVVELMKQHNVNLTDVISGIKVNQVEITEEQKLQIVKEVFASYSIPELAKLLDWDELLNVNTIPAPDKSLPLDYIFTTYTDRDFDTITKENIQETKQFWSEFKKAIGKITIRDIMPDDIKRYELTAKNLWEKKSPTKSDRYLKNRRVKIRQMITYCLTQAEVSDNITHKRDINRLLELCEFENLKTLIKQAKKETKKSN